MVKTGSSNVLIVELISKLKKASIDNDNNIWKTIAVELEKSSRQRRVVNISRLNRYTSNDEIVIVPGKLLGSGVLDHKVTVAALNFSDGAIEKITANKGKCMTIEELMKSNPKGSKVRIIG